MKGGPDLLILNNQRNYNGLAIEFESPTGKYNVSEAQLPMKQKYEEN